MRQAILTPANVSDKTPFLALVQGDEQAVYADRGYDGWWYKEGLARRGIEDGIMACSYWRRPLDAAGRARNRAIAPLRRRSSGPSRSSSAGTAIVGSAIARSRAMG